MYMIENKGAMLMSRPPLKEEKKRKGISISLRQDILRLADDTDNKSKFFEQSVEVCQSISEIMKELSSKKLKAADALEEIADVMDVWEAQFEEKIPYKNRAGLRRSK